MTEAYAQQAPASPGSEAGWYADPQDPEQVRWWNGTGWTDAVQAASAVEAPGSPALGHGSPQGSSSRRRGTAIAVGAAVLLGAVGAAIWLGSADDSLMVDYTIVVDKGCEDTSTGYGDIDAGTGVEVVDGSGRLLGFGTLDSGTDAGFLGCSYEASFEIAQASDGIYRVTSGNENRGYLNYTDGDVVDGTLEVSASLG